MKLKIAQVIGLNTDQKAAQVTSSTRDGNSFFAVLQLSSDDAFTKGRQVLSELEDFYFEFEGAAPEKLNAAFAESEKRFSGEELTTQDSPPLDWDLSLVAISGKVLYIIGKGQVEVYLKRGEKLSPLLSVGTPSQIISGFINPGDRFLLATKSLISFLGAELEKSLSLPIEMFEEELGGKIGASDLENQGLAALAVEVVDEDLEIAPLASQDTNKSINEDVISEPSQDEFRKTGSIFKKLSSYFPKSGRVRLILAVVLIIIIASGAGYKYKLSRDRQKQLQFDQILQQAKDDFNTAIGLATLNPGDAKNKLDLAKSEVDKALALKPNDQQARDFKKQIEGSSSAILQQSEVSDFTVFLDMDLVKKNFRATQMSLSGSKLLLLDTGVKSLVVVDLGKKSNQILAGLQQLGEASLSSINGGLAFVYSKDKGILKIDSSNQKLTAVSKKDSELGEIKDIYGFGGNVYLLDSGKKESSQSGQIWKYLPTSGGYSDKRSYLTKGINVDFSGALRMQIESSVYVLKSGGEMLRFTKGDKDNFAYSGLDKGVKDPKSFFVSSDTDNLYLLDSGNSRLLILTKTGAYKGQIIGSKFATVTDVVVDEAGKKVYLLDGSKIYSVDLK